MSHKIQNSFSATMRLKYPLLLSRLLMSLPVLIALTLAPALIQAETAESFIIKAAAKGQGKVKPAGKVSVSKGQSADFTFQPTSDAYEVKSVKVDGQTIPASANHSFSAVTAPHTLEVSFGKKTFEIKVTNRKPEAGSLQPGKVFQAAYGSSRQFTAKPKKGYLAMLRLDGKVVQQGQLNQPLSFKLSKITAAHTFGVLFTKSIDAPAIANVSIKASDPNGLPLHYQWKVSEGSIADIDAPTTQWTLPTGPGVHFANVLISNQHGGYAARRVAVITDDLGILPPTTAPQDFSPPSNPGNIFAYDTAFLATVFAGKSPLTRAVYLPGISTSTPTFDLVSDLQGRVIFPRDPAQSAFKETRSVSDSPVFLSNHSYNTNPWTLNLDDNYVLGSVALADGNLCGINDSFHNVKVSATATLVDSNHKPLAAPAPVNAFGDYALPWNAAAAFVKLECENAAPYFAEINPTTQLAETVKLPNTGVPFIDPVNTSMSAKLDDTEAGIYLPPELQLPSDQHPGQNQFLSFKGLDNQKSACEYYVSIGAVQSCDAQGNPNGAISFEDWKRKSGVAPYTQPGGQEIEATYVNVVDLNLTRRHHSVSYDEATPATFSQVSAGGGSDAERIRCVLKNDKSITCEGNNLVVADTPNGNFSQVSVGTNHVCALETSGSIKCWGNNALGQTAAPTGKFSQVSAGKYHSCGLKTDGSAVCWGDNSKQQSTSPSGTFSQISAGDYYNCGVQLNGTALCWGGTKYTPSGVFTQISAGARHSCGLKPDASVLCWYDGGISELHKETYTQVNVSDWNECALTTDSTVVCWGYDKYGLANTPADKFVQISGAGTQFCGLKADGTAPVCWGRDATWTSPDLKHRVAAYVCNHLGPKSDKQADVDEAIDNAVNNRNLVACVAMDYGQQPGTKTPYVRFFTFAPNGQLLLSVNLDGRQEKYVPATCVVCHGGDKYDGHFPADGTGSPDIGSHFLPYDVGNFAFSSKSGLTKADQQAAIHQLNNNVLKTNPGLIESTLLKAWYASGSDILDENYLPEDWKVTGDGYDYVDKEHLYKDVHARYCRTCHVALERSGAWISTHNPEFANVWFNGFNFGSYRGAICGGSPMIHRNHTMPNSLVTFNRLWNDAHAVELLKNYYGSRCKNSSYPDAPLDIVQ